MLMYILPQFFKKGFVLLGCPFPQPLVTESRLLVKHLGEGAVSISVCGLLTFFAPNLCWGERKPRQLPTVPLLGPQGPSHCTSLFTFSARLGVCCAWCSVLSVVLRRSTKGGATSSQKWKSRPAVFWLVLPDYAGTHPELWMTELTSESQVPKRRHWIFLVHNESPQLSTAGAGQSSHGCPKPLLGLPGSPCPASVMHEFIDPLAHFSHPSFWAFSVFLQQEFRPSPGASESYLKAKSSAQPWSPFLLLLQKPASPSPSLQPSHPSSFRSSWGPFALPRLLRTDSGTQQWKHCTLQVQPSQCPTQGSGSSLGFLSFRPLLSTSLTGSFQFFRDTTHYFQFTEEEMETQKI